MGLFFVVVENGQKFYIYYTPGLTNVRTLTAIFSTFLTPCSDLNGPISLKTTTTIWYVRTARNRFIVLILPFFAGYRSALRRTACGVYGAHLFRRLADNTNTA